MSLSWQAVQILTGGAMALAGVWLGMEIAAGKMRKRIAAEIRRYAEGADRVSMSDLIRIVEGR